MTRVSVPDSWRPAPRRAAPIAVLLALALALPSDALRAQDIGVIRGTVTTEDGSPLGFAQVVVEELDRGTLADGDGSYLISGVPAGTYTLRATLIGHKPRSERVTVSGGDATVRDLALATDLLDLDALVVTATRNPRSKVESSTAITTMTDADIEVAMPRSTADLLSTVPGFYVESSGGNVGNNLFVRGLPADGSYRYVAIMEDGMPVYGATELFFVNADIFVRVDKTVERMEAVRGGNSALYGGNAPGGVINFISRTGGPEQAGTMKAGVGSDGLLRYDVSVGGPLFGAADEWRYSVGGFYRHDEGLRDPGFPASRGGQIKGNLTRFFDGGSLRVYGKLMHDRNMFMLPLPFRSGEDAEFVDGFPDHGTMTTAEAHDAAIPVPTGFSLSIPLEDGQKQVGGSAMAELNLDFGGGWSLSNRLRLMSVDHSWNAVVPFELVDADVWAEEAAGPIPPGGDYELSYTNHEGEFDTGNNLLALGGLWRVEKPMADLANQLQLQRTFDRHRLTLGGYASRYTAQNRWFWSDILTDVRSAPRLVDLAVTTPNGDVFRQVTDEGFRRYQSTFVNASGGVTLFSVFAGDEIELGDRLRLDLGARVEHDRYVQLSEGVRSTNLGGPTEADEAVLWGDDQITTVEHDFTDWAASAGANYRLGEGSSLYARASRGYKMPILDQYLFTSDELGAERLWQAEAGYKLSSPSLGLSAVGYWLRLSNFPSQDAQVDPETGETEFVTAYVGRAGTLGAELEAVTEPAPGLRLNGALTLQHHRYVNFVEGGDTLDGNQVRRIPRVVAKLGGSYALGPVDVGGDWSYTGRRFSNNSNTIELPAFGVVNARAAYDVGDTGVTVTGALLNALNGYGLTEGNPRLDESLTGVDALFLARPILPRRFTGALEYRF